MDYHIIIFSRLQSYDGGRETWLNMFLPLLKKHESGDINIYFFSDGLSDNKRLISSFDDKRFKFNEIKLPSIKNRFFSVYRILLFCTKAVFLIRNRRKKNSENIFLGIGSFYEAFSLMIYKILFSTKSDNFIVWLRGIWAKETGARHSGLIHRFIVNCEIFFLKNADVLIANGKDTAIAYKEYGFESVVIPNAVDLEKYKDVKKTEDKEVKKISYIGRLSLEKGILDFLKSIKIFNDTYPSLKNNIEFEVVGDGPLRYELTPFLTISNFKYIGAIDNSEIIDYIESIDCGVALTYSKKDLGGAGVSNGLLELMASGRGVICWESPVFQQVLDSTNSFMINESDVNELVLTYKNIVEDHKNLIKKGEKAKEAAKEYSKETHIKKFIEIINEF